MEIRLTSDKRTWNKFVESHNPWAFFQSWEWGEVQRKIGNEIIRWGITEAEKLVGVAQIILVEAKRGTFLHVRHGPVFLSQNEAIWDFFISELKALGRAYHADFIRLSPMIRDSVTNLSLVKIRGFRPSPLHALDAEVCWVLDVTYSEEVLLQQMRKTTRYLIRHAEKTGVRVVESNDIGRFLPLYTQTARRHEFIAHRGIKDEFEILSKSKMAHLLIAEKDQELLSASLFVQFGSQLIYHHSASVPTKTGANYLLQWRAIQLAKKLGLPYYNFWGIAPSDSIKHPWRGLTLFKQGFGGKEKRFLHAQDLPLSPFYLVTWAIESLHRVTKGY